MKLNPQFISENLFDLCASIQHTIVSYLMSKLEKAADETGIRDIGIAGGVAANSLLRSKLSNMQEGRNIRTYIPAFEYCTDNAAMIAYLAYQHYKKKNYGTLNDVCFTRS
jgi:N6-L-threonylcarbamoyladenine synthase